MSSLVETYALACGVPIDQPHLADAFYPLETPLDRVILLHAFAGKIEQKDGQLIAQFGAKVYDYFGEVIDLLTPIVAPLGYRFYQIGAPNEPALKGVTSLCGKTTLHQCAYLVKNAALLIGNDSMWAHVRGAEGKPLVELFGTTAPGPHGPYWKNPEKTILIESHRGGKKPTFATQENPKTINWIPPENVVRATLRTLDLDENQVTRKSVYIGPEYPHVQFEVIPNTVVHPSMQVGIPAIRMDLEHNEQVLAANLQIRKCAISTTKEITSQLLGQFRPNIAVLRIYVDGVSPQWVKTIKRMGIPIQALSRETDPDKLRTLRLSMMDVECYFDIEKDPDTETLRKEIVVYLNKTLDTLLNLTTLHFRSNHFLLSSGKVYLSVAHWRAGRNVESVERNYETVIDNAEFWADQRKFYLFLK